jgi:hypothetical protein
LFFLPPTFNGAAASTACASGSHMASAWEIFGLSMLEYARNRGDTLADSGTGLPVSIYAWARSGVYSQATSSLGVDLTNCSAWTSASG